MVTKSTPVSYWPIFSLSLSLQSQKPLRKLTRPSFFLVCKVANCIELHPGTISKRPKLWPWAPSIQQKFRFEILEIPHAQWNGTFRLYRPDPSHRMLGYCSCKQDTKGQQFCQMKRDISFFFRPKWPGQSKWTTFKGGPKYSGQTEPKWSTPFHFLPKFPEFWAKWKAPTVSRSTSKWSLEEVTARLFHSVIQYKTVRVKCIAYKNV